MTRSRLRQQPRDRPHFHPPLVLGALVLGVDMAQQPLQLGELDLAIGIADGKVEFSELDALRREVDSEHQRPKHQWWMQMRPIAKLLAQTGPNTSS